MTKNFVTNKDVTVRMFKSDLLESFSRVHPAVPLIIYIPLILSFLYRAVYIANNPLENLLFLIIFGIFIWTFTEYFLQFKLKF